MTPKSNKVKPEVKVTEISLAEDSGDESFLYSSPKPTGNVVAQQIDWAGGGFEDSDNMEQVEAYVREQIALENTRQQTFYKVELRRAKDELNDTI